MQDAKAGASLYLLTALLQRLSKEKPSIVDDMLDGVIADQAAVTSDLANKAFIDAIFAESITVLERVKNLNQSEA